MKKVIFILIFTFALVLTGCEKKETDTLGNEQIRIDGIYIDESQDDSVMELVYVFYTVTANDKNVELSSNELTLVVNDNNSYGPLIYDEYNPIYTNYYYGNDVKTIYVDKSFKVCTTYKIPNSDFNDRSTITFKNEKIDVGGIKVKYKQIKSKKNINEISMDLDKETFDTKYIQYKDEDIFSTINDSYVVTFDYLPGITYSEFNYELKNKNGLSHLIDIIDTKILEDKYPNNSSDEDSRRYLNEIRKSYGDYFQEALTQSGFSTEDEYLNALKINYLREYYVKEYLENQITESDIENSTLEGTREEKIESIIGEILTNNQNATLEAMVHIREEYGMKINDIGLAEAYEESIESYK